MTYAAAQTHDWFEDLTHHPSIFRCRACGHRMSHYGPNMCHLTCDEVKTRARTEKEQRAVRRGQIAHSVRITSAPDEVWTLERCEQILARDQAELKRTKLALERNNEAYYELHAEYASLRADNERLQRIADNLIVERDRLALQLEHLERAHTSESVLT